MVQRRQSRNQQTRSGRSQRAGRPVCAEGKRVFNSACVETCPPGTYEEPDKLPLECSSDTFFNRSATKARVAVKKSLRATASAATAAATATAAAATATAAAAKNAASATANAARSAASATANAAKSAASATVDFARRKKAAAAAKMYQSCKNYVTNYEAALATGQDVTAVVPPNAEQIAAEVNVEQGVVPSNELPVPQFRRSQRQTRRY
jgi:hypothetical protein